MKQTILAIILVLTCFVMAYSADPDDKAKALFEDKCDICHTSDLATDIKSTPEGWRAIVMGMKEDNGAVMTKEEAETVIEYLSTHYGK